MQPNGLTKINEQIKWITAQIKCIKDQGCLCQYEETLLEYDELTGILTSTYVDGSTAEAVLNIPRNTSSLNNNGEDGINPFITLSDLPGYTINIDFGTNTLELLKDAVIISTVDLSSYLDNTNLARITSGLLGPGDILTLTRDDSTSFDVDLSPLRVTNTSELINDGENGTNPFITLGDVPTPAVYSIDLNTTTNILSLLADDIPVDTEDLSLYLDNTNLARIVSGNYSLVSQTLTLVRDDSSTIDIDFSDINIEFDNLQTQVNTNTTDIGINTTNITTNSGNISTNSGNIATNTSDIAALQGSTGDLINRNINTIHSVTGGGNLSADRTLSLVNDITSPGIDKFYGTNVSGTKGWHNVVREGFLDLSGRWGMYNNNRWVGPSTNFGAKSTNVAENFGTGAVPILIFENVGFGYLPVGTILKDIEFIGKVNSNQVSGVEVYTSIIGDNFNSGGYTSGTANQVNIDTSILSLQPQGTINRSLINLNYTLTENRIIMVNIRPVGTISGATKRWNVIGKLNYRLP